MKHPRSHIPLLVLAAMIVFVVIALYAYIFKATSRSVERALQARDAVVAEESGQAQSKALSQVSQSTAADRYQLSGFVASSDDIVSLITAIEALGPQSHAALSITSIGTDVTPASLPGTIAHAKAHVDAHGSWGSVMLLLDLAENMPYAVSLSQVRLAENGTGATAAHMWTISFDLQALLSVASSASPMNH